MKTSELTGVALDWAVSKCEGHGIGVLDDPWFAPSTDWAQGGPIIEKEKIDMVYEGFAQSDDKQWVAMNDCPGKHYGPTPLVAAMRCYVASQLGDEVDVPDELVDKLSTSV